MFDRGQLSAYLKRIRHSPDVRPDLETLRSLQRAHLTWVPYENIDIQLGRSLSLAPDALFDKVVTARRGGFCFEMNGTLAMALRAVGFDVSYVEGGVGRQTAGERAWENHVVLLVDVAGQTMVTDAGLGDGFLEPLPLRVGEHRQGDFTYRLEQLDARTWRCFPDPHGSVQSFDFRTTPCSLDDFAERCVELSTSPESSFVKTLSALQPRHGSKLALRARTVFTTGPSVADGNGRRLLESREEFAAMLAAFGIGEPTVGEPELDVLWDKARAQHEVWLAEQADANAG
ncbi:MAG: arylamine N-acetyltransferase family protein [Stackebrandtia sp.]